MSDHIDLLGASGALYRYRLAPDADPRTTASGNFVYAAPVEGGLTILYAGEANNLLDAKSRWPEATGYGATAIYTRLNVSAAARKQERDDLVDQLKPPMNASEGEG